MITTHKKHEHSLQHWFVIMCKIQKTIKSHIHFVIIISGHFFDCILYLSLYFEFLSNRIFFVPFLLTSQNNNIKIVEPSSLCPANFYCLSLNHGDKRKVCFYLHNFIQRLLTFWLACPLVHKIFTNALQLLQLRCASKEKFEKDIFIKQSKKIGIQSENMVSFYRSFSPLSSNWSNSILTIR